METRYFWTIFIEGMSEENAEKLMSNLRRHIPCLIGDFYFVTRDGNKSIKFATETPHVLQGLHAFVHNYLQEYMYCHRRDNPGIGGRLRWEVATERFTDKNPESYRKEPRGVIE